METWLDELVEKEIRFGTEVERDDFKLAVKQFTKCWQLVANEIENIVKTHYK